MGQIISHPKFPIISVTYALVPGFRICKPGDAIRCICFLSICPSAMGNGVGCLKYFSSLGPLRELWMDSIRLMGFLCTVRTLPEEVCSALQHFFLAVLHWLVDLKTGLDHPLDVPSLLPHETPCHRQAVQFLVPSGAARWHWLQDLTTGTACWGNKKLHKNVCPLGSKLDEAPAVCHILPCAPRHL